MMADEKVHKRILRAFNGCVPTIDLIRLYFPHYKDIKSARAAFGRTVEQTKGMTAQLLAIGYDENHTAQPPKITAIFIRYWGVPDLAVIQAIQQEEERK